MARCSEIMTRDPQFCAAGDSVARAAKIMKTQDCGCVPVVEDRQNQRLAGIVTDRDLALNVVAEGRDPNEVKVEEIMTRNPFFCGPDDDLQSCLDQMQKHQVRRIPVVENNRLVGIIALADIALRAREPGRTAELVEEVSKPSVMRA